MTIPPHTLVYRPAGPKAPKRTPRATGRGSRIVRVGIWDIDARAGLLIQLIGWLNAAQSAIVFHQVQAPVPAGLVRGPDGMIEWLEQYKQTLTRAERREIGSSFLVEDFVPHAERVRRGLGLDYLVGITRLMVAFVERGEVGYDYFSYNADRTILVSAYDIPRYARRAKRPYEAALGSMVVSAVLAELMPKLEEYHDETRGCLFDFNDDRDSVVTSFRGMSICGECFPKVPPRLREPALALVKALQTYRPGDPDDRGDAGPAAAATTPVSAGTRPRRAGAASTPAGPTTRRSP